MATRYAKRVAYRRSELIIAATVLWLRADSQGTPRCGRDRPQPGPGPDAVTEAAAPAAGRRAGRGATEGGGADMDAMRPTAYPTLYRDVEVIVSQDH